MDLMMPARSAKGAMLVAVDRFSRFVATSYSPSTRTDDLLHAFKIAINRFSSAPKLLIMDRQSGFTSKEFVDFLLSRGIRYEFVSPMRHSEFLGLAERTIQSLRNMSRASLAHMNLASTFWHFAVDYAAFVKNQIPHEGLNGDFPCTKMDGSEPRFRWCKVFGCVAYKLEPLEHRRNKFLPVASPMIFLGFDNASPHGSCRLYNFKTKRLCFAHFSDVHFHEALSYSEFQRKHTLDQLDYNDQFPINKHTDNLIDLDSSSSDSDSDDDSSHFENVGNCPHDASPDTLYNLNSFEIHPTNIVEGTRRQRVAHVAHEFGRDATFAILHTSSTKFHPQKVRTPGEARKLKEKIVSRRMQNVPAVFEDLSDNHEDKAKWLEAVSVEFGNMEENQVLKLIPKEQIDTSKEIGKLICLLDRKRDGRFKARLVYNGRAQSFKLSSSTASPTLSPHALTLALAYASQQGYCFTTADISSAFLYAPLPDDVVLYAAVPRSFPTYNDVHQTHVIQICKNLYGLKEGPSLWWNYLVKILTTDLQLNQSIFEECCFTGKDLLVLVYVDDFFICGTRSKIDWLSGKLKKHFKIKIKPINEEADFLGCIIGRDGSGNFYMHQNQYTNILVNSYGTQIAEQDTPLPVNFNSFGPDKFADSISGTRYREILGKIGYLRLTRPDVLYALTQLSQLAADPSQFQLECLMHLLGYLKKHKCLTRKFTSGSQRQQLVAVVDASFGSNRDKRSIGASCIYLGSSLVNVSSKLLDQISTSAPEAELQQIYAASKIMLYLHGLFRDFTHGAHADLVVLTDSLSSVQTLDRPVSMKYKFLSVKVHFLKFCRDVFKMLFLHIDREENFADNLTKQNDEGLFTLYHKQMLDEFVWQHVEIEKPAITKQNKKEARKSQVVNKENN